MLSTAHLVTGAAIGVSSSGYVEVLICSVLFHFLLDMVPHWDPEFKKSRKFFLIASADLLFGLLLSFYLLGNRLEPIVLLAMLFSILPDIITFLILMSGSKCGLGYVNWHKRIQNCADGWGGVLSQVIVVFIMAVVIVWSG